MPAGRPPLFTSDEELQAAIEDYFAQLSADGDETPTPPTISGLAYHLGMSTETLRRYGDGDQFCATVKRAKQRVEMFLETRLYGTAPTGTIFNLKNNFGWKDQQDHKLSGDLEIASITRTIVDPQA